LFKEEIIEIKELTKDYKGVKAVNGLNLTVFKGDVFGFLGPNGAGKSTTIRMLLTLIKPTSGTIKIFGKPLIQNRLEILRKIGAIVEKPDFYLYLSAYKNLEILAKLSGTEIPKNKIMELLELVELDKRYNSKVKTFSFGMKQRLGIAQALMHNPDLIILDEPTTGLDTQGMKEIRELILRLSKDSGKTIFISSHILSEIEMIASRVAIIKQGSTVVEGAISEFIQEGIIKVRFGVTPINSALESVNLSKWRNKVESFSDKEIIFNLKNEEINFLNRFLVHSDISVSAIIPVRTLEEYFLDITGKTK
jgi:ABC-type multidrug transport system ATPase subunit